MNWKEQITLVVPCKLDSNDRIENLSAHLEYVKSITDNPIILIESDVEPKVYEKVKGLRHVRYMFVQTNHENFWSRSLPINQGVAWASTPLVAPWDVDVIIEPGQVEYTARQILEDNADFGVPFTKVLYCHHSVFEDVRDNRLDYGSLVHRYLYTLAGREHFGCANIFKREVFRHIRGMSEKFFGWGGEDSELGARVAGLGFRVFRHGGFAWHIDHMKGPLSGCGDEALFDANREEVFKIEAMSPDELRAYFGITAEIGGYLKKT